MDMTWTIARPLLNRDDPEDSDPKAGSFDEVGTGKSDKKPASGSGKDQAG